MPARPTDREKLRKNVVLSTEVNDKLNAILDYLEEKQKKGKKLITPNYTAIFSEGINLFYESIETGEYEKRGKVEKLK